jgi:hypothetical protein
MLEQTPRARSVSELVDATFSLYRRNASAYIMVTAMAVVPGLVVQLIFLRPSTEPSFGAAFGAILGGIISLITYGLMTGVVTKVGSDVYLGGEADVAGAVRHVIPLLGSLIWAGILRGVLYFLYALALFFPVFIAFAKYFAPEAAVVLEGKSAGEAIRRSAQLSDGLRWHILRTLILGYGIYFLLAIALGAIGVFGDSEVMMLFVQTAFTVVAYPIVGLLTMMLYYDARIRKEGFDMEHLSRALGDAPAPPAR